MALQGTRNPITLPITNGANGAVDANLILVADSATPGNAKVSTAAATKFVGVTRDPSDALGYAPVQTRDIVQVRVGGAAVAAADYIASDANGKAVTLVPAASGTTVKQIIGVALTSSAAGALVDVLIEPQLTVA